MIYIFIAVIVLLFVIYLVFVHDIVKREIKRKKSSYGK
tara:strand:+ start:2111 stop:2224 length:114 start_codon:yes stop_codon:yes gene_type:complete